MHDHVWAPPRGSSSGKLLRKHTCVLLRKGQGRQQNGPTILFLETILVGAGVTCHVVTFPRHPAQYCQPVGSSCAVFPQRLCSRRSGAETASPFRQVALERLTRPDLCATTSSLDVKIVSDSFPEKFGGKLWDAREGIRKKTVGLLKTTGPANPNQTCGNGHLQRYNGCRLPHSRAKGLNSSTRIPQPRWIRMTLPFSLLPLAHPTPSAHPIRSADIESPPSTALGARTSHHNHRRQCLGWYSSRGCQAPWPCRETRPPSAPRNLYLRARY